MVSKKKKNDLLTNDDINTYFFYSIIQIININAGADVLIISCEKSIPEHWFPTNSSLVTPRTRIVKIHLENGSSFYSIILEISRHETE